jgi:HEAT repeat protein
MERFDVIQAGFTGDAVLARTGLTHNEALIRASALRALHRMNQLTSDDLSACISDAEPDVRRTVVELSAHFPDVVIHHLVNDPDLFVAEMTAWALGERTAITDAEIEMLIRQTTEHAEPVVREACAAALGSLGDERGLQAVLSACTDKPAVRRRAILALAAFEGDEVDATLTAALEDKDWQVRQNAEDLINPRG